MRTARETDAPDEYMHLVLGLVGEAGEIAEKVKNWFARRTATSRNSTVTTWPPELGDVLWYTSVLANFLGLSPDNVAQRELDELADRQHLAVLGGSGDNH